MSLLTLTFHILILLLPLFNVTCRVSLNLGFNLGRCDDDSNTNKWTHNVLKCDELYHTISLHEVILECVVAPAYSYIRVSLFDKSNYSLRSAFIHNNDLAS